MKGGKNTMAVGILNLCQMSVCQDNCDREDPDGVPCVDIEDPPCYEMCQDSDD